MCRRSAFTVLLVVFTALLGGASAEYVDPGAIIAVASSVNYQLEPEYSCNGSGLTGDLHTNDIGGEPPQPGLGTMWLCATEDAVPTIEYQFDISYPIQEMWVWNYNQLTPTGGNRTTRGIQDCTIEYSVDGIVWIQLGAVHTFAQADASIAYAHNTVISFGNVDAAFVRISSLSNYGGSSTGLSEVRFILAQPQYSGNPSPTDGAQGLGENIVLGWSKGDSAASHDVYLGTDYSAVADATSASAEYVGNFAVNVTSYDPGALGWGKTYYWRVDEVETGDPENPWKGNVWSFTIGGPASEPNPTDGAGGRGLDTILTWTGGFGAESHDVYFGSMKLDVDNADSSLPVATSVYKGRQAEAEYNPSLEFSSSYYWRIDEVKGDAIIKGPTWQFNTGSYTLIDNFETYAGDDVGDTWEQIGGMWAGVKGDPNHGGEQSLELSYYNIGEFRFSEVRRAFPIARNWLAADTGALVIFFVGRAENAAEKMYVIIEDAAGKSATVTYDGDPADVKNVNWQDWNIDLRQFSNAGVDLTVVTALSIGLGDKTGASGAAGYLYIDDVRLYPPRCVPRYARASDLNTDCIVDLADVQLLSNDWLDTSYTVIPTPANAGGLMAHYKFDETTGANAADSSGNGFHATVDANGVDGWAPEGYAGGCLNLDGTFKVTVPGEVFRGINLAVTVSLWVNGDVFVQPDQNWGVIFNGSSPTIERSLHVHCPTPSGDVMFDSGGLRVQRIVWDGAEPDDWEGQWNHYAFTLDARKRQIRVFRNGYIVGETDLVVPARGITDFAIGAEAGPGLSNPYVGSIDDVRIYNYALSQAEVAGMTGIKSLFVELESPAELIADDIVNYKDFAVLAEQWLKEVLWP